MKAKLFTKDMVFIDVIDISQLSFKRQRNKEYTVSCKPIADKDYNWEQVSFIYFLDDNEEKTKRIQYKPCGYLEGYNGESLSIKSMESYLESISVIPENFEWWQNKLLKNVLPDLCYGFRRIKKASLSEMQDVATSYHVKFDVLENGNGEVYADTGYYFSPSNTHELYYYSDGYVIYRMTLPAEARRQGLILRWSDQTGTTTDVSVQFRWSNVSSDFIGTYSAEQSPLRGEGSRKNETVGVDVPESDNTYLFIKFNLKYDTGSTSVFQKGYNYEQEITTVQGEGEENYVYYGKTAILNAFEVIYRVDTRIEEGTISVSDTQLMQADLSNCNSLLSVLKAISEAYKLTFFVSFEENIPLLNVYNEYINDTTNQTIITDKVNSTVTRKEIKTETLQAVEAFGIGNGFDRIHAFVKADDLEANIKNIGKYEGEETSVEDLVTNAKAYIEKENEELSSASFEYYNMPLQVNDKVRVVINKNVYTSLITEENYSFDGDKTKKEYTIGIRKYAFSGFFTSPFSGLFLYKPETPTNLIATRMEQGWAVSWQGKTSRYILQYRRSSISPWNTISVTGTSCTIPFTEYDLDYTFAIYAVDDRGQYSDAMYIYSNSSSEAIYVWETYHDGDTQPDTPTGSGITGGWHRDITQNAKWVSKKEAHRITEGSWSVPFLTSNGVRLGVLDDTPDDVTGLAAVAMKDGIQIQCDPMGVGAKNVVSSFEFELLLEGESEWIPISSFTNSAFYTFNRSTIGYPEASDLDGSQVRCKVKNTYNYYSTSYATASIDTDSYGTWETTAPVLSVYTSKRDININATQGYTAREKYADVQYYVEIKRYDDSVFYKPNLTDDPYASDENYKDGAGYVTVTNYIQQRVPLETQDTDPKSTMYTYKFTTYNVTKDEVGESSTVNVIASASTAQDIVNHSMDAEKLNVQDLAAVSSVFGSIRSDGIAKDSTNFWNLSDPSSALGYGQEGEMCVGTSASVEVFDPVTNPSGYKDTDSFFHFVPQNTGSVLKGLYLKLANFIITAVKSVITGMFEVVQRQTEKTIFKVDDISEYTSGIQTETSITRVDDDAPLTNTIIDKLTRKSVVINTTAYHLVPDEPILLIQNLSTGIETQVVTPILFKGIHNIGGVLHAIGAGDAYRYVSNTWTQIPIDWVSTLVVSDETLSKQNRYCYAIKDNFLYIPINNGTVLEVVDLTTFTVQNKALPSGNRERRCCAIKDNFLYIPTYAGTVLEVVDLTTFIVQDKTLSASNRSRRCCAIKDNFLYIPINNGTVLEVVDLTTFIVQDKTLSAHNSRYCCAIKDNFLYIPTYAGTVLEVVDLTTFTVQNKALSNRTRYCCAVKDNFLYIPINTVLEVVDLTTFTVQDKPLSSQLRYCCATKDNFLYIPISNGTVLEVVDLTTFTVQNKTLSASNRSRRCCAIKDNFLYIPTNGTVLEVVSWLPYLQHKTTTNNTTHILSTSTGIIETIKASDGEYVSLPAPDISGSPLSITIGAISIFPDFTTGKITKYNAGTVTTVNTTARANIKTLITDGTNMFISGLGNVIYKVAQDGTQTALTLSQLSNSIYHTLGIIGTKMYVIPETSSPRFAEVNLSTFELIQYALFSPSWGALRGEGFIYSSKYWLAEKNTKKQHRLEGIKEALSDIKTLKPIGSGFIERTINVDGTTKLETADGERVIFGADKNLIAPTATTASTATLADRAKDSYPIPTDAVLQYSFDEIGDIIIDNSYSEAHATNYGVIPVDGVCGKAGYFNNSYMIAPRPALGDDITIYFWAKFDSLTSMCIVQSRATVNVTGLYIFVGTLGYGLNWGGVSAYFPSHTVPVNTWHFVAIKSNQTTRQLKINNILVASATGTYTNHTNFSTNIIIGKSAVPDGSPLTGALDGLKIVPRYTTDDEDKGEYKARANLPKFYAKSDLTSIVTLRRSANFTLPTYLDGQKIRIANTHATNTITCTLPSGQTMNGQSSFTIAPDTLLEFELIGTKLYCMSKVQELIWINPSPASDYTPSYPETTSGPIEQFKSLIFTYSSLAPDIKYQHSMEVVLTPDSSRTNLFVGQPGAYKSRQVDAFSGNSVQFSSGYAGSTENQSACVPIAIYGVK